MFKFTVLFFIIAAMISTISAFTIKDPSITLSYKITKPIIISGDVQVSWSVPTSQTITNDWISIWWQPVNATYVQYFNVTSHSGTHSMRGILNARHNYVIRYFRGDDSIQETDFFSPVPHVPMHPRLTFVEDDATKMRLSWTCDRVTPKSAVFLGTDSTKPEKVDRVIYVLQQPNYTNKVYPAVDTYTQKIMNDWLQLPPTEPYSKPWPNIGCRCLRCSYYCYNDYTMLKLWADPGMFLNVEIDGLTPGKEYFYRFGEVGGEISQELRSFVARTAPSLNASINLLYVADGGIAFGKLNETAGSITDNDPPVNGAGFVWDLLKRKIAENEKTPFSPPLFHAAIVNGDLSYARGDHYGWEVFHNLTSNGLFDRIPALIQYGNHETDFAHNNLTIARGPDSGGEASIVAGKRFLLDYTKPYYYRTIGPAFIIALCTEFPLPPQLTWLKEVVLPKINRAGTPWVVVFLHRPIHSLLQPDNQGFAQYLNQYSETFERIGVDIVLQGHQHQYTRYCHIGQGVCNTWGYRAVYTTYLDTQLTPAAQSSCPLGTQYVNTELECKVACNKNEKCTGVQWAANYLTCTLLSCKVEDNTMYSRNGDVVYSLSRQPGKSSVYVVDGTAGAEFSTPSVKNDPRVRYTDVKKWGYSTLSINQTTMHWQHFHLDDRVWDDVILNK